MNATMTAPPNYLRTNRLREPIGIDVETVEFSWRLSGETGQQAYDIEVTTAGHSNEGTTAVWRSGVIPESRPFGAPYAGSTLSARTAYEWRVRVQRDGAWSPWSDPAKFETGIPDKAAWAGSWISAPSTDEADDRTLYFRTTLELDFPVVRARAYATALGWYKLVINGVDHTGSALVPRWTPIDKYVEYQVYDVTASFHSGINVVGIVVAEGRYRGEIGNGSRKRVYGDRLGVIADVVLDLADGSQVSVVTDDRWEVGRGRIRSADPKNGERVDLRIGQSDWMNPDAALESRINAELLPAHPREIIAEEVERVQEIARLRGKVSRTPSGVQLVDFGQNFSGYARVRLAGDEGTTARLLYSEVLTKAGELNTGYLVPGQTKQTPDWFQRDEAILTPNPTEYTPSFTIHGFRYLAVEGAYPLTDDDVEGIVVSTDMDYLSDFQASDPRLEQLWRNVVWSLRSNFTDTPTDCPTRERSGWTGDIQVFGPTASQLVDGDAFLRRYLRNLRTEQLPDGSVPPFIPSEFSEGRGKRPMAMTYNSVGWGDVTVMLPWTLLNYYGDSDAIRSQYASAKMWVDSLAQRARSKRAMARRFFKSIGELEKYIVDTGFHWGEWLRPGEGLALSAAKAFLRAPAVVATAYFAHSAGLLAQMATIVGEREDATRYQQLAENVATAWRAAFVRAGGSRIGEDKQDDYVRGLAFDLLLPEQRPAAVARLVELITAAGDHLGTGFLSTPMLLPTLVTAGHADVAYGLLMQMTVPSWLGQIERGATTIWETWEGHDKHGKPLASHNHYAFGSVAQFLQEHVAGLAPQEPGYRTIRFAPAVGGGITSASVSVETPYGRAYSGWVLLEGSVTLKVTVPPGATGLVVLGESQYEVPSGDHQFVERINESTRAKPASLAAATD